MGSGYDVFLSYARSDAAADLNGLLRAQGLSTFFDRSALRPGLRWVPALEEAIGRSKAGRNNRGSCGSARSATRQRAYNDYD
jgi:hypothetical protein